MNFPRIVLTKLIRGYQMLTSRRIPVCRFDPTCSAYAIQAIEHHVIRLGGVRQFDIIHSLITTILGKKTRISRIAL